MDSGSALTFGNVASFFMDDGAVGGEASPGQVDFIRIFGGGALAIAGLGMLGFARRRQRAG